MCRNNDPNAPHRHAFGTFPELLTVRWVRSDVESRNDILANCGLAAIEQESGERSKERKKRVARSQAVYSVLFVPLPNMIHKNPGFCA